MADRTLNPEVPPREMRDATRNAPTRPVDAFEDETFASPVVAYPKGEKRSKQQEVGDAVMEGFDSDEEERKPKNCLCRAMDGVTGVVHKIIPPGGIVSSAFSLASGSIGAGILGLPGGTDTSGLALAVIYLVIITFFSVFSMHLLAVTTIKTNIKTFEGLGRWLFPWGHYAFSYWVAFIRWFYSFGACVGYVISVGDCFKPIFAGALERNPDSKALKYFNTDGGIRLMQALVWLCIMLPLVVPKHIDSLRYASTFAVTMMTYFVIVIIVHSALNGLPKHRDNIILSGRRNLENEGDYIYLFRTGNDATTAIGVFMFAYVCQINALEVLLDMRPEIRTPRNFTWAAFIGMMICGTLYLLVCIFGYFDFGAAKLQSNSILLMYQPMFEPYMMVAYVGVLCKLCVSYALMSMAARNSVYYVMGWQQKYQTPQHKRNPIADGQSAGGAEAGAGEDYLPGDSFSADPTASGDISGHPCSREDGLPHQRQQQQQQQNQGGSNKKKNKKSADAVDDNVFVDNIPMWRHLIVVAILGAVALILGLFIPTIKIVFNFAGAISGGFLAFVFPALFFMYSGDFTLKKQGAFIFFTTYALLIVGVIGICFGTGAATYSTAGGQ